MKTSHDLIIIGTSAGGVLALKKIFQLLPKNFIIPIIVIQHLPKESSIDLSLVFGRDTHYRILEVEDKMPIQDSVIHFASPGYHLLIEQERSIALSVDDPVNFCRPSIDVGFESAAKIYQDKLIGVLLSGSNSDGAHGLKTIKQLGGVTIVQNPLTSESSLMPESAIKLDPQHQVLDLEQIPLYLESTILEDRCG